MSPDAFISTHTLTESLDNLVNNIIMFKFNRQINITKFFLFEKFSSGFWIDISNYYHDFQCLETSVTKVNFPLLTFNRFSNGSFWLYEQFPCVPQDETQMPSLFYSIWASQVRLRCSGYSHPHGFFSKKQGVRIKQPFENRFRRK